MGNRYSVWENSIKGNGSLDHTILYSPIIHMLRSCISSLLADAWPFQSLIYGETEVKNTYKCPKW